MKVPPDRIAALRARGRELATSRLGLSFVRKGANWKAHCPFHDDSTPSLDYDERRQTFKCFGCGASLGDIFALTRAIRGGSFLEAVAYLDDGAPITSKVCRPPPRAAEPPTQPAPTRAGEPPRYPALAGRWRYTNAKGETLGFQDRLDDEHGNKTGFRSWRWSERDRRWEAKAIVAPRPLYGLLGLLSRSTDPVLVTEGEKACDAARRIFPHFACCTSMGGSCAAAQADWTPIKAGRRVVLWPDNDKAGYRYAASVTSILTKQGTRLRVVRTHALMPSGWDLADTLPRGMSLEDLHQLLTGATSLDGDQP